MAYNAGKIYATIWRKYKRRTVMKKKEQAFEKEMLFYVSQMTEEELERLYQIALAIIAKRNKSQI